jgi:hypothetical protein
MKYTVTEYGGTVEWLASNDYQAIPGHVTGTTEVKSGTPITAAGAVAEDGANAVGIVLHDTDPNVNPNVALLVKGIIDLTKMNAHSGLSLTAAAIKAVLPGIVCRENIGVNA